MRRAIELSRLGFPAPNPHVGCVIVRDGQIVGEGFHDYAGGPHAEVIALQQAGCNAKGADVYVTLEPCNHTGRTGPCSEALIEAGVKSVSYAVEDPNPRAKGGGQRLQEANLETSCGLLKEEAEAENGPFLSAMRKGRPFVAIKAASTLDGFLAMPDGESKWITGEEARNAGRWLRAQMGAVLVGANTIRHDDPNLTAPINGVVHQPVRVVLDPSNSVSSSARVFALPGEVFHFVSHAKREGQIELGVENGSFSLRQVLNELWKRKITSLLVEGGGNTIGRFLQDGLCDRLHLFFAPKLIGKGLSFTGGLSVASLDRAFKLRLRSEQLVGEDIWLTYDPV